MAVLCASAAHAQAPYLVTDLNTSYTPNAVSSSPRYFVAAGSTVFFAGSSDAAGAELFTTDGTTVDLVKDIVPGSLGSGPANLVPLSGSTVIFSASDPVNGRELWKSDGTEAGTVLVKDIYVGAQTSGAQPVAAMSGHVFLLASSTGQLRDAWVTDGTDTGTKKLVDSPDARGFFVLGGFMYFYSGTTLWRSDGTPEGTTAVRTDLTIRTMTVAGGHLFFAGWDSAHGYELWMSDGTAAGTILLKDINPGAGSSFNTTGTFSLVPVGASIVFFAYDPTNGWSLWHSDGTPDGTVPFKSYPAWSSSAIPPLLSSAGGLAFFSSAGLWRTDGSELGTIKLGTVTDPSSYVAGTSKVFFFGRNSSGLFRLWSTDGSDAGTTIVSPSVAPGSPTEIAWAGGQLFFSGSDGTTGSEPWVSHGTEGGTHLIANMASDPPASSNPDLLRGTTGRVFFTATNSGPREVWTSDGTAAGTIPLTNFLGAKTFGFFSAWKGNLFFTTTAYTTTTEYSLYLSDGTAAGTSELQKIYVSLFFPSSGYFYFTAPSDSSTYGSREPWRTDGTQAGTIDLSTGTTSKPSEPWAFVELGGRVYFEAGDPRGIWQTDGTPASTQRLTTHPSNYTSISAGMVAAAGALYYSLNSSPYGTELWRTDPNRRRTDVIDIRPGTPSSTPDQLTAAGPLVFFTADDGTAGREVWRSDGTVAGTFMVRDVMPGTGSSSPRSLTAVGNRLFFVANDGLDGFELWTSDGSTAGTELVADLAPGAASFSPDSLVAADGLLWFSADDGSTGRELWKSDGTPGGTQRVADLNPGATGSDPRQLVVAGRELFFNAQTSLGRELWALALNPTAYTIDDARVLEGNTGTTQLHFKVTRSGDLSQASSVAFVTSDGTATAGADYVAANGTVVFAAGASEAFIDVTVNGDTQMEDDESLSVTISSPTLGVLQNNVATGIIEEDDRSAALSIQYVQASTSYDASRTFVVTNTGPSDADGVTLTFTESPTVASLSGTGCSQNGYGSLLCVLGSLAAGESRTVSIGRYTSGGLYNSAYPPGYTITASVSTLTAEADLSDNSVTKMVSSDGSMALPPFLTSSLAATLDYLAPYTSTATQTVSLTSSNAAVAVTPTSATIPPGERHTTFTLQPGDVTGSTKLTIGSYGPSLNIAIVASSSVAKLDPMMVVTLPYSTKYGQDVQIPARVAARAADGTYPSGVLKLLDDQLNMVDQQTLDATASVKFVLSGLSTGSHQYSLQYDGDSLFTALTVPMGLFYISPYYTSMRIVAAPVTCDNTVDVAVIVSTSDTTQAPTGSISVSALDQTVQATLVPTGVNGTAQATVQLPIGTAATYISATYTPTGAFSSTNTSRQISVGCASSMNLVATATAINRVMLTWSGTASTYEVYRYTYDSYYANWSFLGYAGTTQYLDSAVLAGRSYLYRVRPTGSTAYSAPDLATTVMFADDPIVAQVTSVKATHFSELLAAANSVRQLAGFANASFATPPAAGGLVRATPILELRAAIAEARRYLAQPEVTYTDPSLAAGMLIKAAHLQELRNAVK
ncbi:MAG TPA: ELWxxDGT repeat protein [Thermoanaerobaculia bacterium]|nr:ELWxxDGT repeat protein [Thermoanaerobaculia bacterium]